MLQPVEIESVKRGFRFIVELARAIFCEFGKGEVERLLRPRFIIEINRGLRQSNNCASPSPGIEANRGENCLLCLAVLRLLKAHDRQIDQGGNVILIQGECLLKRFSSAFLS